MQLQASNDASISLPTGSGKSLCYVCKSLFDELFHREGSIVVVVSPEFMSLLTSLMVDQVSQLV